MVIQYLLVLCSNLIDAVGNAVDAGFTNSIGINEIAVFGVVCSIHGLCYTFGMIGGYYFRLYGKNEKDCFWATVLIGCVCTIILVLFSDKFRYIYRVESNLYDLLRVCIVCLAVTEPVRCLSCLMQNYCLYAGYDRLNIICLVIFYLLMFVLDAVAVLVFHSLPLVILFTGVANIVYVLIIYLYCKWYRKKSTIKGIVEVFKGAMGYFGERSICRGSLELRSIFAAALGTHVFALYTVINKVSDVWECAINALQTYVLKNLRCEKEQTLSKSLKLHNSVGIICALIGFLMCIAGILITRGDFRVIDVLIPNILYFIVGYLLYTVHIIIYSVFILKASEKDKVFSGIMRLVGTSLCCIVLKLLGINSWVYIFANPIGILFQFSYMYIKIEKGVKNVQS